jgi:tRNA threonylcarbamoyl adenosine modification protein YeaZ
VLLAIDTSAGTSVAVVDRDAGVLAARDSADTRGHAENIGTFIAECLAEAGVSTRQLSGVVAGMGPGPFTGLRVGIAAARAFALGAGKPVISVVSHDALAFGRSEPTLVVTDARRREVYWSLYGPPDGEGLPARIAGPALSKPDELQTPDGYVRLDAATVSAASLGLLAEAMYFYHRPFAGAEALYLRSPDVTPSAGPKRVTS